MPYNGSGQFLLPYDFRADRDAGPPTSKISADRVMAMFEDIALGLQNCITADGQIDVATDFNMAGHRLLNLPSGATGTEPVTVSQLSSGQLDWAGTYGGTSNALTAAVAVPPIALVAGLRVRGFVGAAGNTGPATLTYAAFPSAPIVRPNLSPMQIGDLIPGHLEEFTFDGANWRWETDTISAVGITAVNVSSPLVGNGVGVPIDIDFNALTIGDAINLGAALGGVTTARINMGIQGTKVFPLTWGGTGNAVVASVASADFAALNAGHIFELTMNATNSVASPTLNVDGTGVFPITDPAGGAPGVGYLVTGRSYLLMFVSSQFRVLAGAPPAIVTAMTGASVGTAGTAGSVPGPVAGDHVKFLRGDATWALPTTPIVMTAASAGSAGANGYVPAPAAGQQNSFLRGDATWVTIPALLGATVGANGLQGLAPTPLIANRLQFLRGDATWMTPPDMTGAAAGSTGVAGYVPAPTIGQQNRILLGSGSWVDPKAAQADVDLGTVLLTSFVTPDTLDQKASVGCHRTFTLPSVPTSTSVSVNTFTTGTWSNLRTNTVSASNFTVGSGQAGKYLVIANTSTDNPQNVYIRVSVGGNVYIASSGNGISASGCDVSIIRHLNSGDVITASVSQASGAALAMFGSLYVVRLGS